MKCKNCGARVGDNSRVCPNCGAACSDDGYVLLTSYDKEYAQYDDAKSKKSRIVAFVISAIFIALVAVGAFYYFGNVYESPDSNQPQMSFETGSGIINGNQKVIYVTLKEDSKVQYIHGVSLYDYNINDKSSKKGEAISTDYEYTKNIDSTFRTIFFFVDDLNLKKGKDYIYTFEMEFGFVDSDKTFTYSQAVKFNSDIKQDVSSVIFDHSLDSKNNDSDTSQKKENTTKTQTSNAEQSTSADSVDISFIYNSYWYTAPIHDADNYMISALKFNRNNTFTSTQYLKAGNDAWKISNYNGKYTVSNNTIIIDNGDGMEQDVYIIDARNKTLTEQTDDQPSSLASRKYNSVKNAEDFFGI